MRSVQEAPPLIEGLPWAGGDGQAAADPGAQDGRNRTAPNESVDATGQDPRDCRGVNPGLVGNELPSLAGKMPMCSGPERFPSSLNTGAPPQTSMNRVSPEGDCVSFG
jgi:hypothetical protein